VGSNPAVRTMFMYKKPQAFQPEKTHELSVEEVPAQPSQEILMLEDEGELTALLKEYLEAHAFRVTSVSNGVDGLKKVMSQDYDAVVCDMLMPHLPGDMFFLAVQKVKPHLCKRFVFMTGHKGDKKIDEFIRSVHGVMMWKPFQPHELMDTIKYVIKRSREN
jgi:two-component system cell cycle sensor histidine kinase/response regulator CckA